MNQIENYEISLDKLTKRVEELRNKEKVLNTQQQALNKAFKEGKITEQQYQKAMAGLNKELSSVAQSQKQLSKVIDQYKKNLQESAKGMETAFGQIIGAVKGGLGQLANGFQQMRDAANQAVKELTEIWNNVKAIRTELDKFGDKQQTQKDKEAYEQAVKNGNIEAQRLYLQNQRNKAIEAETNAKKKLAEATKKAEAAQAAYDNRSRWVTEGKNDSKTLAKNVELAERAVKDAQDAVLTAADNLTDINDKLAELSKKEDERKKKADEERLKREKDLHDKRLKAIEEQKKADEDAIKQLEDLRVKCIHDETLRKKAQIELDKKRAIEALDKIYEKAGENGKKAAKEAIDLLKSMKIDELMSVDAAKISDTYKQLGVDMTQIMRGILLDYEQELAEEPATFVKEVEGKLYTLSAPLDNTMQQWMDEFCDEFEKKFELGLGGVTDELMDNIVKSSEEGVIKLTNGYTRILAMTDEQIREMFSKSNIKSFADPANYKEYLDKITESLSELRNISPQFDKELQLQARISTHELNELEAAGERLELEDEKITVKVEELTNAENKRFEENKKQIEALAVAEMQRLNNIFPEIDKVRQELEEISKEEGWTREEFYKQLDERVESTSQYKDYLQSMMENEKALNERMEQLKITHEASIANIEANAENERTILQQEHFEKVKEIEEKQTQLKREEAEKRKQIIAEEWSHAADFMGSMSDMFSALGSLQASIANDESKSDKEREKARKKQLNLQIASVYLGMANSLAQGISTATSSSSNWIEMLIAIATTVASVVSQFAQIKSLMSQRNSGGYATGGEVKGKGSGTSDSIDARLSNGEYVVRNEVAQNNLPLLNSLNFGGGNNNFIEQLATAMAMQPAPQVAVQTIERVQTDLRQTEVYSHM